MINFQEQKEQLEKAWKARCEKWLEATEEYGARPGLRIVEFDVLRLAWATDWLDQVFEQLPNDAVIIHIGQHLREGLTEGTYYQNKWFIVVASKEWSATPQDAKIPRLDITLKANAAVS